MSGSPAEGENRTLTAVPGLAVGHAHDPAARTGCTVVLGPFAGAVDTRGLATGTRELDALSPLHIVPRCDAILLTGGSAFGLSAADGVVRWLEERDRGFETAAARVPIVPAAVIYDLGVGRSSVRPGPEMGYAAAADADARPTEEGPVGAGCGATVGKLGGPGAGEPSGVGTWAEKGESWIAALAVVNAFGDVVDAAGRILAGSRGPDGEHLDTARALREGRLPPGYSAPERGGESTTLGFVATDAGLDRWSLQVMARQAMNGLVRRIRPAGTPYDGDLVFAVSTGAPGLGGPERDEVLGLALRAEEALARAIERSVERRDRASGGGSAG